MGTGTGSEILSASVKVSVIWPDSESVASGSCHFLFGDVDSKEIKDKDLAMELPGYGYDWVRLRRNQEK
jgi:hypothetical protein